MNEHHETVIIDLEFYVFSIWRRGDRWEMRVWDLTETEDHWTAFIIHGIEDLRTFYPTTD